MQFLKANTQVKVVIGPFVDVTDGFTPETGITLGAADEAELMKHDASSVTDISGATWAAITGMDGYYNLTLTTSHTDTEGLLTIAIQDDSVCLPVRAVFMVLAEAAYDSLFTAKDTGYMDINVKAISEDTTAADNLESACDNYSATRGLAGTALPDAAADAAGGLPISDAGGLDLDAQIGTDIDAILADTNEMQGKLPTNYIMGSSDVNDHDTDIDAILVDTAEIGVAGAGLTEAGGTGDQLTAIPWNASWDTEVQSEVADALAAFWTSPATLVDLIWDEVLNAAGHNVPSSAGRRIRTLQEYQGYDGGMIWVNTTGGGTAGTTPWENGTVENPVDTWADALTLNAALGYNRFALTTRSSITLTGNSDGYKFFGEFAFVDLNGQSVDGASFELCAISGDDSGDNTVGTIYRLCNMTGNTLHAHYLQDCTISGNITLAQSGTYLHINNTTSSSGTITIDTGVAIGDVTLLMPNLTGDVQINNMGQVGTDTVKFSGGGRLTIDSSCVGGTIEMSGMILLVDNSGGAVTVNDNARIDTAQVNAQADLALSDYDPPTKAEMDAGHALLATEAKQDIIDANVDLVLEDTGTTLPASIAGLNDLDAAGVRTAIGMSSANLDTQIAALPTAAENRAEIDSNSTQLAAIVGDTNELQTDWANGGRLDLIIDAILADTGTDGVALASATLNSIADAILKRGISNVEDSCDDRSMTWMMAKLVNKIAAASGTLTVKKSDDSTTLFTQSITSDADADPITGLDTA